MREVYERITHFTNFSNMSSFMIQSLLKSHVSKSIVSAPPLEVPDEMLVSSTSDQGNYGIGLFLCYLRRVEFINADSSVAPC